MRGTFCRGYWSTLRILAEQDEGGGRCKDVSPKLAFSFSFPALLFAEARAVGEEIR